MSEPRRIVARVHAALAGADYQVDIQAGRHALAADEPPSHGGADAGAAPYELLLSGLAACTAITLRMYAQRKGWALKTVEVDARLSREDKHERIDRSVALEGELDGEQKARMLEIAEKTPVTLTLKRSLEIHTTLR